jgi:hypothetical protein
MVYALSTQKVAFIGQLTAERDEELAKLEQVSQEKAKVITRSYFSLFCI